MTKYLGWIIGGASTLLVGAMTPLMGYASPSQNTTPSTPTVSVSASAGSTNTPQSQQISQSTGVQQTLPEKIRYVDGVATSAVGGGTVTNIAVNGSGQQSVWTMTVQKTGGTYAVQVSMPDYAVVDTQQVN